MNLKILLVRTKLLSLLVLGLCLATWDLHAQVTTSSISGRVTDAAGELLPGATVTAIHIPSGTQYGTVTSSSGEYVIPSVRVGGPYLVKVTFIGFADQQVDGLYANLGSAANANFKLQDANSQLAEVVVTSSKNDVINSDRTGAATTVSNSTLQSTPNISRGLKDFTKLSPLANTNGSGTSFAGANNRYNQFSIDGLVSNDVFGLAASGTNGGQTGIEPISLDAIEQFQISIAPYDVTQGGFTGGGINAVTRSGSNKVEGSVYYFGNNEKLVGKINPNTGNDDKLAKYSDRQVGFRLGGPLIKNKLFLFVNGEWTNRETPLSFTPGQQGSNITVAQADSVANTLSRIAPGYDPGGYLSLAESTKSRKFLARLDWNINNKHKLTLRHSYTYGEQNNISRSSNQLRFANNGYLFPSTTNSTGLELNSTFGSSVANHFLLGYTSVRDDRDPIGNPFPMVTVLMSGGRSIVVGNEYSSVANQLDQNIFTITDNVTLYKGKHTLTFGTHNEFYSFYNLFVQNIYGNYSYRSLADFASIGTSQEVAPVYYAVGYSLDPSDDPSQSKGGADWKAFQLGFYAQDQYNVTPDFKLTGGLRVDIPVFSEKPAANSAFNQAYSSQGVATDQVPSTKLLWSPRIGFNWDVKGDRTLQVRGGSGLFTGRVPFVWLSNQYSNTGQLNGSYSIGTSSNTANPLTVITKFEADPYKQPKATDLGGTAGVGDINVTDKNLKYPQVFRSNLAVDKQLPGNVVLTLEAIFSKTYNNVRFMNLNRVEDPAATFTGVDDRIRYKNGRVDGNFSEIIKYSNTNKGYSYNLVAQLQKQFGKGLNASAAYTYGVAKDVNAGTSSTAYSNWRYYYSVNGPNRDELSYTIGDLRHRVIANLSYKLSYLDHSSTQISVFYSGQVGPNLAYVYNGDLNLDGTSGNDMIYIPRSQSEIELVTSSRNGVTASAEEQWQALNAFIEGDSYLKSRRGEYAERYGKKLPWQNIVDVRLVQDIGIKIGNSVNKLQFTFDILNVGNLINSKWGKQYSISNNSFSLINFEGVKSGTNIPTYSFKPALTNDKPYTAENINSRWRAQFGIRYLFN